MTIVSRLTRLAVLLVLFAAACPSVARAQTAPANGIRQVDLRAHAIVGATAITRPGERQEGATILIRDGVIEAVGAGVEVPADARIRPGDGLTVYAGLIECALLVPPGDRAPSAGAHWNDLIRAERSMAEQPPPDGALRKELRELGFTMGAVYPDSGILRGTGTVIALAEKDEHVVAYRDRAAMAAGFDRGRGGYPRSLMGAVALMRQALCDARWHAACRKVYAEHPEGSEPPVYADALIALEPVVSGRQQVFFDASGEHDALRAARVAREFELDMFLLGSGDEYRRLKAIVDLDLPIVVPLRFPDRPNVETLAMADRATLRDMMAWEQAPANARRLVAAGATVALTTHRLKRRNAFYPAVRNAIRHGLSEDAALAALTTVPAKLLGIEQVAGTIEPGKTANLVVVKGGLFDDDAEIRDTWVNGRWYEVSKEPDIAYVGKGRLTTGLGREFEVELDTVQSRIALKAGEETTRARSVKVLRDQLSFTFDGAPFDATGTVRFSGAITGHTVIGSGVLPDGTAFRFAIEKGEPESPGAEDEADDKDKDDVEDDFAMPPDNLLVPLGAFGRNELPKPESVLIRGAAIWTAGPAGIIEEGDFLVEGGRIVYVGPEGGGGTAQRNELRIIDARGKHITPGLIDCHSHTGISGGVNEGSHANTAEVRIADVIDPDDIDWYRQLAGGLTAANQLHGSANPIGGQNAVVKLKWGSTADGMLVEGAIPGIKLALGENVVRNRSRYPNTRMGVEMFLVDAFTAAREYQEERDRYRCLPEGERRRTMPPRRDLQLDALVEVLEGERIVHCHSYRQDEILAFIRVAERFGFTIGTFQHVLEGYKVAEAIAGHGAGASTFSDWWAYKMEVMDAIPYNGTLLHAVGVNVSFNSDSSELARRLNTEAAKAVRYGGLDPHEALKFVTINPARQLRIDRRTGSLEGGKDADFVIWSGNPLSTYSRVEQTWIEGARYFDIETDREMREHARRERQRLIQKILGDGQRETKAPEEKEVTDGTPPEDGSAR